MALGSNLEVRVVQMTGLESCIAYNLLYSVAGLTWDSHMYLLSGQIGHSSPVGKLLQASFAGVFVDDHFHISVYMCVCVVCRWY